MNLLIKISIGLISFGFLIFTHEFGHYISAILFKIRVSEFSIGFGPKIFSKKKNGITYKLSLFPIGGYVKMPEKLEEESSIGVPFSQASVLAKITTLLAGSLSNIIFGYLTVLFIFLFINNGQLNFEFSNLFGKLIQANNFFKELITIVFDSLKGLMSGQYGVSDLSGPIGVTTIISESLKTSFESYSIIMSFITINIGIFNLLPIPALDGCRALFCFVELLLKDKFPTKMQEKIHTTGLIMLLGLIVIISLKDIMSIFKLI